jgi:hypothetical protein
VLAPLSEGFCVKSSNQLNNISAAVPLLADDILEFHAARLLLLFLICGKRGRIDGLTKMAKLDFFVRYPGFFDELCQHLGKADKPKAPAPVESAMVRHHYGPWDQRYYQLIAYLEGRGLIEVIQSGKSFSMALTPPGTKTAKMFRENPAFSEICTQMRRVKDVLGDRTGTSIKNLIYKVFSSEIAARALGDSIENK